MKKIIATLALSAALIACASCGNNNAAQTTTTTASAATTTTAAEAAPADTTSEKQETEAKTEQAQEDNSGKTQLIRFPNGTVLYSEDGKVESEWEEGFTKSYNTAFVRMASGLWHDSITEPALFNTEDFEYSGETAALGEIREVKVGDTFGGLTVKSTDIQISGNNSGKNSTVFGNNVELDGEITLTGILRFYFDEQYAIMSGDMIFTPDSSYAGLPCACDPTSDTLYISPNFDSSEIFTDDGVKKVNGDGPAFYSDSQKFLLGNLFENYADNSELNSLLNGGKANISKKVEVTLTNVKILYSEQFGANNSSAVIKSIKEV